MRRMLILVAMCFFSLQHFQRDIVRGVEGYIVTGSKQVEIGKFFVDSKYSRLLSANLSSVQILIPSCAGFPAGTKLSEDSRKYGVENTCTSGSTLSKAASNFARARAQMEKERGNLLKALGTQVIITLP